MSDLQTEWTEAELLATDPIAAPLVAAGRTCHGGFDADGAYRSPRTRSRFPAIRAWQQAHRDEFGVELLDVPLATWPEPYPNLAQSRFLLREGVRDPIVTTLTRIGTVEGFGALLRHAGVGDLQPFFAESVAGTALAHLDSGLFEAHARDEAGWQDEAGEPVAGHRDMWFAARDVAFDAPVSEDETEVMLQRMGLTSSGGAAPDPEHVRRQMLEARQFDDVDLGVEMLVQRMLNVLFIEISAFHVFAWAEELLADDDLVAGDGEAARIVGYIRQDEMPHVEYLKTALSEMHERTFVTESGGRRTGAEVVGALWDRGLDESLGVRRQQQLRTTLREVELALDGNPRRDDLLEEFHALGSVRPSAGGELVAVAAY
jgi:hypothetical protein